MNWPLTSGRVAQMCDDMGLSRKHGSGPSGFSERAIANWETGGQPGEPELRRVRKMQRVQVRLAELVRAEVISYSLDTPNDGFGGLNPLGVIERGEIDRLRQMNFCLESGRRELAGKVLLPQVFTR